MLGTEKFICENKELDFDLKDFWSFQYSNIYSLHGEIAEFVVARALGITEAQNSEYWTLWDILYRDYRIEIKQTGYYHPWNENGKISNIRRFGITKANSDYEFEDMENKFERQNDIYVFCLNTGETKEESNPMNIDSWEFYVVPTKVINEVCGGNKSIGLNKVREISKQVSYDKIKETVDFIIDNT